ncbi:MATE family efflux transporter [Muricomes sp. OA1]|uniref:MATE family efflux transporter n=1 Tax=Hungatella hathewayi TaxID=154046 RepID=A0A3E2WQ94_9FIRM|nr:MULTISPECIES: MATE family efflux transporter [Clostridia]MCH1975363.1 MATE family efflux transporter [Muricomes sp. OA1]RGC28768.1 MATE family efflux transporter [Hungatella hathewayi]GKH34170.1 MATE family efflux transporter [Faecalicatena contorta]
MKRGSQTTNQITEGVIWRQLLLFFFPIVFGTFFQQLYNTIDTVIVGHFVGKEALASVGGSSAQIIALIVGFFTGLSSGASVVIAQFFGAQDERSVRQSLHTAYAFSIMGSIIISILGIVLAPSMLSWMHTPAEIMADSILYLRIYFAGILFVFIFNMGSSILRAVGDSRHPLYYLIICCFLNIVLDAAFVVIFRMGVLGVALATFLSQAFSAALVTHKLMKAEGILRLFLRRIRFHGSVMKSQLRIGIPAGVEAVMYSITNVIIQAALNGFGTDTAAAWSVFGKLDAVFWMVSSAFGISITTFVGQNYGARKNGRIRKITCVSLGIDFLVSAALVVFLIAARVPLFRLFTTDTEVIRIGTEMLLQVTPWYITFVFIEILSGSLRGIGDVIIPMIITLCGVCLLRVLWIVGALKIQPTISAIIFSYPITWIMTSILFICYYFYRIKKMKI